MRFQSEKEIEREGETVAIEAYGELGIEPFRMMDALSSIRGSRMQYSFPVQQLKYFFETYIKTNSAKAKAGKRKHGRSTSDGSVFLLILQPKPVTMLKLVAPNPTTRDLTPFTKEIPSKEIDGHHCSQGQEQGQGPRQMDEL